MDNTGRKCESEDKYNMSAYVCLLISAWDKVDNTTGSIECDHSSACGDNGTSVGGGSTFNIWFP